MKWGDVVVKNGLYISKVFRMSSSLDGKLIKSKLESVGREVELLIRSSPDLVKWSSYYMVNDEIPIESLNNTLYYQLATIIYDKYSQGVVLKKIELFIEDVIIYENYGDMDIPIKLNLFDKVGNQEIKIYNNSTNEGLVVNNLNKSEILYIDSENETIISSQEDLGVYRYDNHNDVFLHLASGKNFITTKGEFELDIQYQEIYLQD